MHTLIALFNLIFAAALMGVCLWVLCHPAEGKYEDLEDWQRIL